ncbi:hypothetical protein [Intestinibacter sp.]
MFSEKLNFLILITKTKNSELARAASIDASHISRLRNGNRKLPKNQTYVLPMAQYFARHITDSFQRRIVGDILQFPAEWPKNEKIVADLIYKWLTDEDIEDTSKIDVFLTDFASSRKVKPQLQSMPISDINVDLNQFCYYGIEGKRNAILRFLTDVLNEDTPQTMLLYSDEEMSWLYEDSSFAAKWSELLIAILKKGNKIKIIHTISRNLDEMIGSLNKWIPLYITGAIEPYYYPKLRDGIFQKTLFIAPKTAAIISSSVKQNITDMLNLYIIVPEAITALTIEFNRYLSLCHMLMNIINATKAEYYWSEISDFVRISAPTIMFSPTPSLMTMPESLAKRFSKKSEIFYSVWKNIKNSLELVLENNKFYEIIVPPTQEQISSNTIPIPMNDFFRTENLCYTVEEYKEHLEAIIKLTKRNPNYYIIVNPNVMREITLYVKENIGVILSKVCIPSVVFTFRDPHMTAAFWDYISKLVGTALKDKNNRGIKELEDLINKL